MNDAMSLALVRVEPARVEILPSENDPCFSDEIPRRFLCATGRPTTTVNAYTMPLRQMGRLLRGKPWGEVDPEDCGRYHAWLLDRGFKPNTVAHRLAAVRSMFAFAVATGLLKLNPMAIYLKAAKSTVRVVVKAAERCLTFEEYQAVRDAAQAADVRLYIEFLYLTGMRLAESLAFRLDDVRQTKAGWVYDVTGKGGKTWPIALPDDLVAKLRATGRTGRVFTWPTRTIQRYVAQAGEAAGIEGLSPHWFRHTHATLALEGGAQPVTVSRQLGHSSFNITLQNYIHTRPEDSSSNYLKR